MLGFVTDFEDDKTEAFEAVGAGASIETDKHFVWLNLELVDLWVGCRSVLCHLPCMERHFVEDVDALEAVFVLH